jgi:hypothetical protein
MISEITRLELQIAECTNQAGWLSVKISLLKSILMQRDKMIDAISSAIKVLPRCEAMPYPDMRGDNCPMCCMVKSIQAAELEGGKSDSD